MKNIKICTYTTLICGLVAAVVGCAIFFSGKITGGSREKTVDSYLKSAEYYREDSNYQKALVSYEKVLEKEKENIHAVRGTAEMYAMMEYYAEAESTYETLLNKNEVTEEDRLNYVDVLIKQKKLEEAKSVVEQFLDTYSSDNMKELYTQMNVEVPVFNLTEGSYDTYQLLKAQNTSGEYSIYYTLDGSEPTQDSNSYSGSIVISAPENIVKAKAFSYLGYGSETVELNISITVPIKEIKTSGSNYYFMSRLRNEVLDKNYDDPIYNYELAQIRNLYVVGDSRIGSEVTDAVFYQGNYEIGNYSSSSEIGEMDTDIVRYMPFLQTLAICWQKNISLDVLTELHYLEELSLLNNNITDISALRNLKQLRVLSLGWNRIQEVSPIAELTNLESLGLWNNQITDISPLGSLHNLYYLDVSGNKIENIDVVRNFPKLNEVWVNGNPITDTSPLDSCVNIRIRH